MDIEIREGDYVNCIHCGKEFHIKNVSDNDWDDFDSYFEHLTTCDGEDT